MKPADINKVAEIFYERFGENIGSCTPEKFGERKKMYNLLGDYFRICEKKHGCNDGAQCDIPELEKNCGYFMGKDQAIAGARVNYEKPKQTVDSAVVRLGEEIRRFQAIKKRERKMTIADIDAMLFA